MKPKPKRHAPGAALDQIAQAIAEAEEAVEDALAEINAASHALDAYRTEATPPVAIDDFSLAAAKHDLLDLHGNTLFSPRQADAIRTAVILIDAEMARRATT